jgi:hypothetical protein
MRRKHSCVYFSYTSTAAPGAFIFNITNIVNFYARPSLRGIIEGAGSGRVHTEYGFYGESTYT